MDLIKIQQELRTIFDNIAWLPHYTSFESTLATGVLYVSCCRYRSSAEELTVDHVIFHLTISDGEFTTNASIRLGVAANVLHIINLYPGDRFNVTDRVPAVVASELEIQSDLE